MLLLNGKRVPYFIFPGGEIQVKLSPDYDYFDAHLCWKPCDSNDIMLLVMTVNALSNMNCTRIHLEILYMPYGRQDRVCSPGEANGLKAVADIINALPLTSIMIYDEHSIETDIKLFDSAASFAHVSVMDIFFDYELANRFDRENLVICSPDKGAIDRGLDVAQIMQLPLVECDKIRNPENGLISHYRVPVLPNDSCDVLIVDDICDGGSTFLHCAKALRKQTAGKLFLYVTHGIFSRGLWEMAKHFTHIYCHHVLHDSHFQSDDFLTILRHDEDVV